MRERGAMLLFLVLNKLYNMNWNYLYLINGDNINIVYHYPTSNIMLINDRAFQVLESLKSGTSISGVAKKCGYCRNDILSFIRSMHKSFSNNTNTKKPIGENRRVLERITLHVSNDCNLRCKYCFAGGGNYNQTRGLMTIQTAKAFVDFCVEYYDEIGQIVFFGGEPMLNVDVMKFVCSQFETYYKSGKSSFIPRFGIITNGTVLTPSSLQFIKESISIITVSIDGPKEINDINRIYKNGKGSYTKIAKFIHTILKETDVHILYESTFTQSHIDTHYSHSDVANSLRSEFGIKGLIVNEKGLDSNCMLDCLKTVDYETLVETDFEGLPADFWPILHSIIYNEACKVCPIIKDVFAVSAEGTIYPCHMLNGVNKSSLGNINGENIFNSPTLYTSFSSKLQLKENDTCKECWAQKLCGGCAVQRFYNGETEEFTVDPNAELCRLTQQYIEQMLIIIANIRTKSDLWLALIEKEKRL